MGNACRKNIEIGASCAPWNVGWADLAHMGTHASGAGYALKYQTELEPFGCLPPGLQPICRRQMAAFWHYDGDMRRLSVHFRARWARLALAGMVAVALIGGIAAQPGPFAPGPVLAAARKAKKRLILTDGSHIDVVRFKVKRGEVRYRTRNRGEWQFIPASQVDWKATERWARQHPHGVTAEQSEFQNISPAEAQRQVTEMDREEHAQRATVQDLMPVVMPGLRLPDEGGVFALDRYDGQPELIHLQQPDGDLNQNPFHSVQPVDVYRMHAFATVVRMQGVKAAVQLHVGKPVFYVSLHGAPLVAPANAFVVDTHEDSRHEKDAGGDTAKSRFVIVRVVRQGEARVIFARQLRNAEKPDVSGNRIETREKLMAGGYWMKVTPVYPLVPGEYALVELLGPRAVNRDVWDFGVNPNAPENLAARLPVKSDQ